MILFGPSGVPHSCRTRKTEDGVREVKRLGLDCMEVEFVRGVKMSRAGSALVRQAAEETGVVLTAHGPYFINLAAQEEEKAEASVGRILDTARRAAEFGGMSITFHAAFYQERSTEVVFQIVVRRLEEILRRLAKEGISVIVAPELTGKPSQFGSLEELIRLCRQLRGTAPCIDFAHYVAREAGAPNSERGFRELLFRLKKELGPGGLQNLHMHVSGIEWSAKGEKRHLRLADSPFEWEALLAVLVELGVSGIMICESPVLEEDALLLKREYLKRKERRKSR